FGHSVWGREHVVEQARCGNRRDYVSLFARKHCGQRVTSEVDVGHDVDIPDALPVGVDGLRTAGHRDAGVRTQDVDASFRDVDFFHKLRDVGFIRYVAADGHAADLARHAPRIFRIDVRHDHDLGARHRKFARESSADASSTAGNDHDAVSYFHEWQRESTPAPTVLGSQ